MGKANSSTHNNKWERKMKRFYGLAGGLALAGTASAALLLSDATTTGTGAAAISAIANWVSPVSYTHL